MAAIFTPEKRALLQVEIVRLLRSKGRMTVPQLGDAIHVSHDFVSRSLKALTNLGEVYYSPSHGAFPTEKAFREWLNQTGQRERSLVKKGLQLDEAEVRAYDRYQNIICSECRNSEVMQRVLAFYRGNFQEVVL